MTSLATALENDATRRAAVADCCALIESEVASKSGLSGVALKTGYKAIKGIRPGFVEKVVFDLLPEFAQAIDPLCGEAQSKGQAVSAYLPTHAARAADALLAITDRKAERSTNSVVKNFYGKLRTIAKSNVEQAIPGLARIIEKHAA
jgi:hypothetical protein